MHFEGRLTPSVLALLIPLLAATSAVASPPDVRGVHLGDTAQQARAAMAERYSEAQIEEQFARAPSKAAAERMARTIGESRLLKQLTSGHSRLRKERDLTTVMFSLPPDAPRVLYVSRSRAYPAITTKPTEPAPGIAATRTAIEERYGTPVEISGQDGRGSWSDDEGGELVWRFDADKPACGIVASVHGPQSLELYALKATVSDCSRVLAARIWGTAGLVRGMTVSLIDWAAFARNRQAFQQLALETEAALQREKLDAAPPPDL